MATSVITNTILDSASSPIEGVDIIATLKPSAAFLAASGAEVLPRATTTTNASGVWSLTLTRNNDLVPAGTYYQIQELIPEDKGGARIWAIEVASVDRTLQQSLVTPTKPSAAGTITVTTGDARYTLA